MQVESSWLRDIRALCMVVRVFRFKALDVQGPQQSGLAELAGRLTSGNTDRSLRGLGCWFPEKVRHLTCLFILFLKPMISFI